MTPSAAMFGAAASGWRKKVGDMEFLLLLSQARRMGCQAQHAHGPQSSDVGLGSQPFQGAQESLAKAPAGSNTVRPE
jgi:hypothetical protein